MSIACSSSVPTTICASNLASPSLISALSVTMASSGFHGAPSGVVKGTRVRSGRASRPSVESVVIHRRYGACHAHGPTPPLGRAGGRAHLPHAALVGMEERVAALLGDERTVGARDAPVARELEEHPERGLRVV